MIRYSWKAASNDGAFEDKSKGYFETEKEAYNDMRNAVLEKMKWNTEYDEDLSDIDYSCGEFIGYNVKFTKTKIVHDSFSGVYTYEIVKEEIAYVVSDTDQDKGYDFDNHILALYKTREEAVKVFDKRITELIGKYQSNGEYPSKGATRKSSYFYIESSKDRSKWNEVRIIEVPIK